MMSRCLLCHIVALLILASISEQIGADITFVDQPHPGNIYAYVGVVLIVPCRASTSTPPPPHNVPTTLYLNSSPFNIYFPPPRYGALTDDDGVIIGFVISGVKMEDNGTMFSCTVEGGASPMQSTVGTLIVRDGTPGSVAGVAQIDSPSSYCITMGWSPAPFPPDSPVLLYTITVATVGGAVIAKSNVSADDTLQSNFCGLSPNTAYSITVVALNEFGYGDSSPGIMVQTSSLMTVTPLPHSTTMATTSTTATTVPIVVLHPTSFPVSTTSTSLNTFYIVLGSIAGFVSTLVFVTLVLIACVVWKRKSISSINIRELEAAGGGGMGSPGSVKKFAATVPLKELEVSPVLGRSLGKGNTSTPCSSETSTSNNSPSLCTTSGGSSA